MNKITLVLNKSDDFYGNFKMSSIINRSANDDGCQLF